MKGIITRIRSVLCEVDADGRTYQCKVRRRLVESDTGQSKPVTVGDEVVFEALGRDEGVIESVLPRRTKLSRRSPKDQGRRIEHVIVANVDQLLIVVSVRNPPLGVGIIDRYIIAGDTGGLQPIICINKVDLAEDEAEYAGVARSYVGAGYQVLTTSAITGAGMEALRAALKDKSTVLCGHSGVGKSSLINAVQPGLKLKTGPVNIKGRHVTASVSLLRLDFGGYVVDTPGIRELSLWEIRKQEVAQFYPAIWDLSAGCSLPDCMHIHEPGCAVKKALETGELPADRYESYVRIVETIEEQAEPRATDVERPDQQIARKRRVASRRKRKQDLSQLADQLLHDTGDEEGP
jgi:ribosome biogenesis GTPase